MSLTKQALKHLAEHGALMIDAFFPSHYAHVRLARHLLFGASPGKNYQNTSKHTLSSILWRLKKDGLVASHGPRKKTWWRITSRGKNYLRNAPKESSIQKISILLPKDGVVRLVSFDIPESARKKRRWLRSELIASGFQPLHKSVLWGEHPIPQEVVTRIDELNLGKYVHILSIQKAGTIQKNKN